MKLRHLKKTLKFCLPKCSSARETTALDGTKGWELICGGYPFFTYNSKRPDLHNDMIRRLHEAAAKN
jgi:hypothetical protein